MTGRRGLDAQRFEQRVRAVPAAVGLLRDLTEFHLSMWGMTAHTPDLVLIVSELATNAVNAAPGAQIDLRFWAEEGVVGIELEDPAAALPALRAAAPEEIGGRGLEIVDLLVEEWGTRQEPRGSKVVWVRYRVGDAS
ncbi:ATP-binding protein [Spirillospora sp. NPDC048911]|uniref:ATP-binding protein n=1 Tax=Spirillospora sp. NPDC048911 TaxID=3364527 RepID=UPI0037118424